MNNLDFFLHNGVIVHNNANIGGSIVQGTTTQSVVSNTTIVTNTVIDSSDIALIQSASYLIQIASVSGYQITEVMLVHDGSNSYLSEYGRLSTAGGVLARFDTVILNNQMHLTATSFDSSAKIWFHKTEINSIHIP